MALETVLLTKVGFSLLKVLAKLYRGTYSLETDLFLAAAGDIAPDSLKRHRDRKTLEDLERSVTSSLADRLGGKFTEREWQVAAARVMSVLEGPFLFEALFENIETPRSIPQAWRNSQKWPDDSPDSREREAFDLLLIETSNALVEILHQLPGFQKWLLRRIRLMLSEQREISAQMSSFVGQQGFEDLKFDSYYREKLIKELDKVELFIEHQDLREEEKCQRLDIAYVTLQLASGRGAADSTSVNAEALLESAGNEQCRLIILGKAGSGKTTLLRWFGLKAAQQVRGREHQRPSPDEQRDKYEPSDLPDSWLDHVPFFIRLRDYPRGQFPTPSSFIGSIKAAQDPPRNWAQRILAGGRALLLIDGLDELTSSRRSEAVEWIRNLIIEYSNNIFVVSSRPEAVAANALVSENFREYEVQDLSYDGKLLFIRQWHAAVAQELVNIPPLLTELPSREERLIREVKSNRSVSTLASNPLLCALLCALNRTSAGSLPSSLRELCQRSIQMLIRDRDHEQEALRDLAPSAYRACDLDLRTNIARNLAYATVMDANSVLSKSAAISDVRNSLHSDKPVSLETANKVFEGLLHRSNLIRETGRSKIEFVHNDLRDYLASLRFADDGIVVDLIERLANEGREKWQPIILFATGDANRQRFRNEFVRELLGSGAENRPSNDDLVLAMRIADQVSVPLASDLEAKLKLHKKRFLPLTTLEKVRGLAAAGEAALPYLAYAPGRKASIDRACIKALASLVSEEANSSIEKYFLLNDESVLSALAEAVGLEEFSKHRNVLELPAARKIVLASRRRRHVYVQYINDLTPLLNEQNVQALSLHKSHLDRQGFEIISRFGNLNYLDLDSGKVEDSWLELLIPLKELSLLRLDSTRVTDVGMQALSRITSIRRLYLNRTVVSDTGFDCLSASLDLELLFAASTGLTDVGARQLPLMANLQTLSAIDTGISDEGLKSIGQMKNLEWLAIDGTHITDQGLGELSGLGCLRYLSLCRTSITDDGLRSLGDLRNLESVELGETNVTIMGIRYLCKFPGVESIAVDPERVTEKELAVCQAEFPGLHIFYSED